MHTSHFANTLLVAIVQETLNSPQNLTPNSTEHGTI